MWHKQALCMQRVMKSLRLETIRCSWPPNTQHLLIARLRSWVILLPAAQRPRLSASRRSISRAAFIDISPQIFLILHHKDSLFLSLLIKPFIISFWWLEICVLRFSVGRWLCTLAGNVTKQWSDMNQKITFSAFRGLFCLVGKKTKQNGGRRRGDTARLSPLQMDRVYVG